MPWGVFMHDDGEVHVAPCELDGQPSPRHRIEQDCRCEPDAMITEKGAVYFKHKALEGEDPE